MNPIITGVIIGISVPILTGLGALAIKMIRKYKKRAKELNYFDPKRCVLHGEKIDELLIDVKSQGKTQDLLVGGMLELLTVAKFGKSNGGLDKIYEQTKEYLTNRNT